MSRRGRTWMISGALALAAVGGRESPAIAVTFNGVYLATVQLLVTDTCDLTVTQLGSDLALGGSGCEPLGDVSASGTIDSASGAFSVGGQASTPVCNAPGSLTIPGILRIDVQPFVAELRGTDGRCCSAVFDTVRLQTPERLRARAGRAF